MEPKDKLDANREYLETWVERNRRNQELLPLVTDELERVKWEIQVRSALTNHPEAGTTLPPNLNSRVEQSYAYLMSELPMLPEYKPTAFTSIASVGTAVAADFYAFISQTYASLGEILDINQCKISYYQLQQRQNRPQEVLQDIRTLNFPELEDRFAKAQKAYYAHKNGTMVNSAAASELRNLIYSLNGYLLSRAREKPSEQKLRWEQYATRLAPYLNPSHLYDEIVRQGEVYKEIKQLLSEGGKDRSLIDIESVWTRILDHIYIVLGSISV